jgi:hypothetical protein
MSGNQRTIIPIYTSRGDVEAFLAYPHLYNLRGEWIGWVTPEREVFSVLGRYVGYLSGDPRILRKRTLEDTGPVRQPPTAPMRMYPPATVPLAPMFPELFPDTLDVLLEEPERLPTVNTGALSKDMD